MDKIASLHPRKQLLADKSISMRGREIHILPYPWGLGKKKTLAQIYDEGIRVAAIDDIIQIKKPANLPFIIANGKLLKIALLPLILNQTNVSWQDETITINGDTLAGLMSAHILAKENQQLWIKGKRARKIQELLFREYGIITNTSAPTLDLEHLPLPKHIIVAKDILPLTLAEALLLIVSPTKPTITPAYLFSLARRASYYGFELLQSEDN